MSWTPPPPVPPPPPATLVEAVQRRDAGRVRAFLALGVAIDERNHSLCVAAADGSVALMRLLLDSGADPNARGGLALTLAVDGGHLEAVRLLLERGASPDALHGEAYRLAVFFPTLRPVMGEGLADEEPGAERAMYLGFLDILDLLGGLLSGLPPWVGVSTPVWRAALAEAAPRYMARRLVTLPSRHDGECVWEARVATLLLDVVRGGFMASPGRATHRVAVFDDRGDIHAIISQSDVVRYIAANADSTLAGRLGDATLQQLRLGAARGALACAGASAPAVEALAAMRRLEVSALAVLSDEEDGQLVGNLSASDLRGVVAASLEALAEPVQPLLRRLHASSADGVGTHPFYRRRAAESEAARRGRRSRTPSPERSPVDARKRRLEAEASPEAQLVPPIMTATAETPFRDVVARLAAAGVHRIYLADERGRPTGVVTLTDVLRVLLEAAA